MQHPRTVSLMSMALWFGAFAAPLPAQGQDPAKEIQEIARQVDEMMQEIDRLLLESGKRHQARQKPKELLQQARERSEAVEGGIDRLIEKLNEMKNQSGGGSSQPQDQQDQQDQQNQGQQPRPNQGQGNRRENQTPEFQQRPQKPGEGQPQPGQPQPGQPQPGQPGEGQPQPQGGQPNGGQENRDGGQNTTGNRQPEPDTGPGQPGQGEGSWGELQSYLNALKNKGSAPTKVPEKFRKYWEAYLKQKQGPGGK